MNFADKLILEIIKKGNPVCVGLDPQIDHMPLFLKNKFKKEYGDTKEAVAEMFFEFNKNIIDEVCDLVPAIKLNIAFYEKYGWQGVKCFEDIVKYAHSKKLIVIEDAKRNDTGNTSLAYADGALGKVKLMAKKTGGFDVDSLVVNPYMGSDTVRPFLETCKAHNKGIFILVKTSNQSSGEFQDLVVGGKKLYEIIGKRVNEWGRDLIGKKGYSSVGMVVGATYPDQAILLRKNNPRMIFLVPGYGKQEADSKNIKYYFNKDGLGAIINSSRAIDYAYLNSNKNNEEKYAQAARLETIKMIDSINSCFKKV